MTKHTMSTARLADMENAGDTRRIFGHRGVASGLGQRRTLSHTQIMGTL